MQPNQQLNQQTLEVRLNESDAFDKIIEFKPKDRLEIVLNNLSKNDLERMKFFFEFKKGKWVSAEFDLFELMNQYDELAFGKFK